MPLRWVMLEPRHVDAYLSLRPDMAGRIVSTEAEGAGPALDTVDELALTAPGAEVIDRFPERLAQLVNLRRLAIGPRLAPGLLAKIRPGSIPRCVEALAVLTGDTPVTWPADVRLPQVVDLRTDGPIRFSHDQFSGLRAASIYPSRGDVNLDAVLACEGLEELQLLTVPKQDVFARLQRVRLTRLGLLGGRLERLDGIEPLQSLRWLRLHNLRHLTSLAALRALPQLEELEIRYCRRIGDIATLAQLPSLRRLQVIACGALGLDAIRPLLAHLDRIEVSASR